MARPGAIKRSPVGLLISSAGSGGGEEGRRGKGVATAAGALIWQLRISDKQPRVPPWDVGPNLGRLTAVAQPPIRRRRAAVERDGVNDAPVLPDQICRCARGVAAGRDGRTEDQRRPRRWFPWTRAVVKIQPGTVSMEMAAFVPRSSRCRFLRRTGPCLGP